MQFPCPQTPSQFRGDILSRTQLFDKHRRVIIRSHQRSDRRTSRFSTNIWHPKRAMAAGRRAGFIWSE